MFMIFRVNQALQISNTVKIFVPYNLKINVEIFQNLNIQTF